MWKPVKVPCDQMMKYFRSRNGLTIRSSSVSKTIGATTRASRTRSVPRP
jgi:hypothetical protein